MIFSFLVNNSDLFQQGLSAKHLLNQLGGNLVSKPPPNHQAYSGQTEAQNKDVENKKRKDGEYQSEDSQSLVSGKRSRKKIRKRKQVIPDLSHDMIKVEGQHGQTIQAVECQIGQHGQTIQAVECQMESKDNQDKDTESQIGMSENLANAKYPKESIQVCKPTLT